MVVEEFVAVDSGDESDGSDGKPKKQEENKEGDILGDDSAVNKRPHKVKTHIEIDDVSTTFFITNSLNPISWALEHASILLSLGVDMFIFESFLLCAHG